MRSCVVLLAACSSAAPKPAAPVPITPNELRSVASFASIGDRAERSRALFTETTRVFLHPRCANCHPADDSPRQGDAQAFHDPPVVRGPDSRGVPAMQCATCHQDANQPLARVPGAPGWHLAPIEMAWIGKTPAQLCAQLSDPERNGGKSLAQIVDHVVHDPLVAWGWQPGADRVPAPGSAAAAGALLQAWIDTGAVCP